ncbi:MAG: RhuM family protein [Bacteroidales bacterium]|nr:RhuM family protein [Bacteroidales bacterium]
MNDNETNNLPSAVESGEVVLYQPDKTLALEVRLEKETVWLTQQQMAQLFQVNVPAVNKHIKNIYEEGELQRVPTISILETVRMEGNRRVKRKVEFYNLDVIISVGYRIKSQAGTRFRQWANMVLKEYLLRGYSVNRQLVALQERMDNRFVAIENRLQEHQQQIEFFVKANQRPTEVLVPTGCVWDAWEFVSGLVKEAKERIVLIDNYVDERVLTLMSKRAEGVTCTIRTHYNMTLKADLEKHNAQYAPIEIVQLAHANHDRYLIIDNTVWLLGTSVKDMGNSLTTIIQVGFTPEEIIAKL